MPDSWRRETARPYAARFWELLDRIDRVLRELGAFRFAPLSTPTPMRSTELDPNASR